MQYWLVAQGGATNLPGVYTSDALGLNGTGQDLGVAFYGVEGPA